jgi:hypothetical protein
LRASVGVVHGQVEVSQVEQLGLGTGFGCAGERCSNAARLRELAASEPPSPTIFRVLLLVALDDLGVANPCCVGILS